MQRIIQVADTSQHPPGNINSNSELDPSAKRLMLSAHLSLVVRKLRRGICVEEQELLALLPFTVPNGWQAKTDESNDAAVIDSSDEDWRQRVASVGAIG